VRRLAEERDTLQFAAQRVRHALWPIFRLNRMLNSIRAWFTTSP
jgi:hypothetical protein